MAQTRGGARTSEVGLVARTRSAYTRAAFALVKHHPACHADPTVLTPVSVVFPPPAVAAQDRVTVGVAKQAAASYTTFVVTVTPSTLPKPHTAALPALFVARHSSALTVANLAASRTSPTRYNAAP